MEYTEVVAAGKGWTKVRGVDGKVYTVHGDRNWRNNNPGNIEAGKFTKSKGSLGSDGRFAVFPSYEAGREAQRSLIFDNPNYSNKSILGVITKYAPPHENNTKSYANNVAASLGVPVNTPVSDLTLAQQEVMLSAMQKVEGFKPGRVKDNKGEPVNYNAPEFRSTVTPGSALLGPVTNGNGDQLLGPVFGSMPIQNNNVSPVGWGAMAGSTPVGYQPAQNLGTVRRAPLPAPQSIPKSYDPKRSINPGANTASGWADMAQANKAIPSAMISPGFPSQVGNAQNDMRFTSTQVIPTRMTQYANDRFSDRLVQSGIPQPQNRPISPSITQAARSMPPSAPDYVGPFAATQPTPNRMTDYATTRFGERVAPSLLSGPVQAVAPVQSVVPAPGDQLLGPVDQRAKDYAKTQKRAAIPGLLGKVGGSMAGGALLGPVGGILGGMLGGYIAKNGLGNFKNEPLNINNIGSGSSNVYSVYGGAPRGTQAQANNGSLITSLGQGATAYTNSRGVTTIQNADGSNAADWSGRSYSKKK